MAPATIDFDPGLIGTWESQARDDRDGSPVRYVATITVRTAVAGEGRCGTDDMFPTFGCNITSVPRHEVQAYTLVISSNQNGSSSPALTLNAIVVVADGRRFLCYGEPAEALDPIPNLGTRLGLWQLARVEIEPSLFQLGHAGGLAFASAQWLRNSAVTRTTWMPISPQPITDSYEEFIRTNIKWASSDTRPAMVWRRVSP